MIRSPTFTTMMPARSGMDHYRSLPGTPRPMDPRMMSEHDISMAMNHARIGLESQDYFHSSGSGGVAPRYTPSMRPRSPYAADYEPERYQSYEMEMGSQELNHRINSTNLAATLANSQIPHTAKYAKVFPHLCEDGRYPPDFSAPKTVESLRVLDNSQLDRIFQAYRLPSDVRSINGDSLRASESSSSSRHRQAKLLVLLQTLGAWQIHHHDRLKRGGGW